MGLNFKFNEGQEKAIELAELWYKARTENNYLNRVPQVFEITGPAGSGKTSIIYGLVERLGLDIKKDVLFLALVGQAAFVMRTKGLNAQTIHSAIMAAHDVGVKDIEGKFVLDEKGKAITYREWTSKSGLALSEIKKMKLVVVDEGSMVTKELRRHIERLGLPIIVLGDLDQLPPVFGDSAFLQEPDVRLTKVERQSGDSAILQLADMARSREEIPLGVYGDKKEGLVITQDKVTDDMLRDADIIICGTNKMRNVINNRVREIYGFKGLLPNVGEKIVFRKNNWNAKTLEKIPITNGLQVLVEKTYYDNFAYKTKSEYDNLFVIDALPNVDGATCIFKQLKMDREYFMQGCSSDKMSKMGGYSQFSKGEKAEFGYAITCHMAQGSQYKKVLIFEEVLNYQLHHKWLYTAITRAVDEVIIVKPKYNTKMPMLRKSYNYNNK